MPVRPEEVDAEIRERMPNYDVGASAHAETAKAVGAYLSDGATVVAQLRSLNEAMLELAQKRAGSAADIEESTQQFINKTTGEKSPQHFHNLLTSVLADVEVKHGFQLASVTSAKSNALLLTDVVKPEKFREVLQKRQPFKDPTVPGGHGEFTHRIQWYCLMTQSAFAPAKSWADFYQWVGTQAHTQQSPLVVGQAKAKEPEWTELGLWDALFDRNRVNLPIQNANGPYNTDELTDFRSPENLHKYITTQLHGDCPLLAAFLATREKKRTESNLNSGDFDVQRPVLQDYLAKKLFGETYGRLEEVESQRVDDVIKQTTWAYD